MAQHCWRCRGRAAGLLRPAAPEFYVPNAQQPGAAVWFILRARTDPHEIIPVLNREIRTVDPGLRVSAPVTMDETISGYFPIALVAGIAVFCAAALFLATLGLYGVTSHLVHQRTHEFGVRVALGAGARDLRRLVLGHGLKLAAAGAVVGLAAGLGLARVLAGLMQGVEVSHPLVFVAVAAILCVVEIAACYLPARRAARISPIDALRYQ